MFSRCGGWTAVLKSGAGTLALAKWLADGCGLPCALLSTLWHPPLAYCGVSLPAQPRRSPIAWYVPLRFVPLLFFYYFIFFSLFCLALYVPPPLLFLLRCGTCRLLLAPGAVSGVRAV